MRSAIIQLDGWYWPLDDVHGREAIARDCASAIEAILPHITGRNCIVQAGANVGVYPVALADHFRKVVTCEPDPTNFACLELNLAARDSLGRVGAFGPAAFGARAGQCSPVEVERANCGAHRVDFTPDGPVSVVTIDFALMAAGLACCDCLWLDVEGSELLALQGAADTIERLSPTIAVEDKGLQAAFDIAPGALQEWLAERGYVQVAKIGHDKVFTRTK